MTRRRPAVCAGCNPEDPIGLGEIVLIYPETQVHEQAVQVLRDTAALRCRQAQIMRGMRDLAGAVAHEFNNLLVGVLGNAELLADVLTHNLPDAARRHLEGVRRAGERAASLSSRLRTLGAGHNGLAPVDLNSIIRNTLESIRRQIRERIEIRTVLHKALQPVRWNATDFSNLLIEAALNAQEAMPESGTLTITTANVLLPPDVLGMAPELSPRWHAHLCVADTGSGMSTIELERMFEPFFSTRQPRAARGLGLALAFATVTNAGGCITAQSSPGQGTKLHVYVPHEQTTLGRDGNPDRGPLQ